MEPSFHDAEAPLPCAPASSAFLADRALHEGALVQHDDETTFRDFLETTADHGVHIVCAAGPESLTAAALLLRALGRAGRKLAGASVLGFSEQIDSATTREHLAGAPALLMVGLHGRVDLDVPQLTLDGEDDEPLPARAFRLAERVSNLADVTWCAAAGLVEHAASHVLIERALWRTSRTELIEIAALLDAAARGPEPAPESLVALQELAVAATARQFLEGACAESLRRTQAIVRSELARAVRVRPRPGFGVVVVEYDSACRLEDLVAARWRGLRAGTVVLVANHGAVDGSVAVTAKAAMRESVEARLGSLRAALADEGTTLLDRETWAVLRERLGVAAAPIARLDEQPFELSALPN